MSSQAPRRSTLSNPGAHCQFRTERQAPISPTAKSSIWEVSYTCYFRLTPDVPSCHAQTKTLSSVDSVRCCHGLRGLGTKCVSALRRDRQERMPCLPNELRQIRDDHGLLPSAQPDSALQATQTVNEPIQDAVGYWLVLGRSCQAR